MFFIEKNSFESNKNMFLNNLLNRDFQQKSELKNTSNSKLGCFILSVQNKLDSINEMICRKKIIRNHHSVIEAIELKLANNDISEKSLKKIERKIKEINKNYSFLDAVNIKKEIISKTQSANEPVCEKISAMLDRNFGIDIHHSMEKLSSMVAPKNDFTDVQAKNKTVNADVDNTEFLNSVRNHQKILINKKECLISKDSYTLAKIEEVDAEDDNDIEIKYFENKMKDSLSNLNDASEFKNLRELNQKLKNDMQKYKTMDSYKLIKSSFR